MFGQSHAEEVAKEFNLKLLAQMPIDPNLAQLADKGEMENAEVDYLDNVIDMLESMEA